MRQRVKEKLAIWLFLPVVFFALFIILLQLQRSPALHRSGTGLEAASNPPEGHVPKGVNDNNNPIVVLLNSGRRSTLPAGRKELNPALLAPEGKGGEHDSEGLEDGGGLVHDETKTRPHDWLDELIQKLWMVESNGRLKPREGDGGLAIGPLQIHPAVVKDVNKFCGARFSLEDRKDLAKSKLLARLYVTMWMDIHKQEIAARIYNGGPRGWQKKSTDSYWRKIQKFR